MNEARNLEDDWISNTVQHNQVTVSLFDPIPRGASMFHSAINLEDFEPEWQNATPPIEGDHTDMIIGLLLGFLFGVIVLPFLYEKQFSVRRQMGIMAGLLVNIIFGVVRMEF
jgi:hypothetical protein